MLGVWLANQGHTLVYGGGDSGLMGVVARAAFREGGQVIGVVPKDVPLILSRKQDAVTELILEENMSARKQRMMELADAYIALPGGIGTLDEISEIITMMRLGMFRKPCIFVDQDGFYQPLRQMLEKMVEMEFLRNEDLKDVLFTDRLEEIGDFIEAR